MAVRFSTITSYFKKNRGEGKDADDDVRCDRGVHLEDGPSSSSAAMQRRRSVASTRIDDDRPTPSSSSSSSGAAPRRATVNSTVRSTKADTSESPNTIARPEDDPDGDSYFVGDLNEGGPRRGSQWSPHVVTSAPSSAWQSGSLGSGKGLSRRPGSSDLLNMKG